MSDSELLQAIAQIMDNKIAPLQEDISLLKQEVASVKQEIGVINKKVTAIEYCIITLFFECPCFNV